MTTSPKENEIRPCCCDACPVNLGLQGKEYVEGFIGCHGDLMEGIEPVAVCRGLAIANKWISGD